MNKKLTSATTPTSKNNGEMVVGDIVLVKAMTLRLRITARLMKNLGFVKFNCN